MVNIFNPFYYRLKHRQNRMAYAFSFIIEGIKKILEAKSKDSNK